MNYTLMPLPLETLHDRLNYDLSTGAITWKKTQGRYARAGELAGTITKRGDVVITLLGRKLSGFAVAWAMGRGAWPTFPLYALDGDKENLRLVNIAPRQRTRLVSPATAQVYQQRDQKQQRRISKAEFPNIHWDERERHWTVYDSTDVANLLKIDIKYKRVRGTFTDADAAIDCALEMETLAQIAYTFEPNPDFADAVTPRGLSYSLLSEALAYDPDTGVFVWRAGAARGIRADVAEFSTPGSKRFVPYLSTRFWAHLLAYFYTTGEWPPRKRLVPIDGNYGNTAASNLTLL